MIYSDIKERHIYYVDFNPIEGNEFKDNHLSVVLKKNNDRKTFIVMPLTSNGSGQGFNKVFIDEIQSLPDRLKRQKSYAVYDQVRTVDLKRFEPIFEKTNRINIVEVKVHDNTFTRLVDLGTRELEKRLLLDEKLEINMKKFSEAASEKIINLAYEIKRSERDEEKIKGLRNKIKGIIYNSIEYKFTDKDKENGIENIINDILGK